ncbi:MAG: DUF1801 domain-containing protein [Saprospiraceae bacterium]|nr:DUF1801 domain-containing protein [Saprospiraceae bacterium]
MSKLNNEVTKFLDGLNHPLHGEIKGLRQIILNAVNGLSENIKWNGLNYCFQETDRITMKIQPPKQIQIIFHCGAKKQAQPPQRSIQTSSNLLTRKENDRAIATFKNFSDIEDAKSDLAIVIREWIIATYQ